MNMNRMLIYSIIAAIIGIVGLIGESLTLALVLYGVALAGALAWEFRAFIGRRLSSELAWQRVKARARRIRRIREKRLHREWVARHEPTQRRALPVSFVIFIFALLGGEFLLLAYGKMWVWASVCFLGILYLSYCYRRVNVAHLGSGMGLGGRRPIVYLEGPHFVLAPFFDMEDIEQEREDLPFEVEANTNGPGPRISVTGRIQWRVDSRNGDRQRRLRFPENAESLVMQQIPAFVKAIVSNAIGLVLLDVSNMKEEFGLMVNVKTRLGDFLHLRVVEMREKYGLELEVSENEWWTTEGGDIDPEHTLLFYRLNKAAIEELLKKKAGAYRSATEQFTGTEVFRVIPEEFSQSAETERTQELDFRTKALVSSAEQLKLAGADAPVGAALAADGKMTGFTFEGAGGILRALFGKMLGIKEGGES